MGRASQPGMACEHSPPSHQYSTRAPSSLARPACRAPWHAPHAARSRAAGQRCAAPHLQTRGRPPPPFQVRSTLRRWGPAAGSLGAPLPAPAGRKGWARPACSQGMQGWQRIAMQLREGGGEGRAAPGRRARASRWEGATGRQAEQPPRRAPPSSRPPDGAGWVRKEWHLLEAKHLCARPLRAHVLQLATACAAGDAQAAGDRRAAAVPLGLLTSTRWARA